MQQACCAGTEIARASGAIVPRIKSVSRTLATKRCIGMDKPVANRIMSVGLERKQLHQEAILMGLILSLFFAFFAQPLRALRSKTSRTP